jgi:comEA protein
MFALTAYERKLLLILSGLFLLGALVRACPDLLNPQSITSAQYNSQEIAVEKINLNTADYNQLITLTGIGPVLAQRILDYRNSRGEFKNLEDLEKVSGLGPKKLEKLKPYIIFK